MDGKTLAVETEGAFGRKIPGVMVFRNLTVMKQVNRARNA